MSLAEIGIGTIVTIERVGGERSFRRRLMELGLVPGTRVEIVSVAPLGDPLELLVRGSSLSIRRAEAGAIAIRHDQAGAPAAVIDERGRLGERALVPATEARGTP